MCVSCTGTTNVDDASTDVSSAAEIFFMVAAALRLHALLRHCVFLTMSVLTLDSHLVLIVMYIILRNDGELISPSLDKPAPYRG